MRWWEWMILEVYEAGKFALQVIAFVVLLLCLVAVSLGLFIAMGFIVYVGVMTMVEVFRPDLR